MITLDGTSSAKISAALLRGPAHRRQPGPGHGLDPDRGLRRVGVRRRRSRPAWPRAGSIRPGSCWSSAAAGGRPGWTPRCTSARGRRARWWCSGCAGPSPDHPSVGGPAAAAAGLPVVIWWPGKARRTRRPTSWRSWTLRRLTDARCPQPARGRPRGPGQGVLPRRHRPQLDPADPVAGAAGRRPRPVPGDGHLGAGSRPRRTTLRRSCSSPGWEPAEGSGQAADQRRPGITAVRMTTDSGRHRDHPDRTVCWPRTPCRAAGPPGRLAPAEITELITEELRRMDADRGAGEHRQVARSIRMKPRTTKSERCEVRSRGETPRSGVTRRCGRGQACRPAYS